MYIGIALVALALGYKVLVDASKEKEGLKILGQAIGIFVILASVAGFVCGVTKCIKKNCDKMGKAGCPISAKANCPTQGSPAGQ
jgi:hypothetical protein